ncbi:hypothetical protein ACFX2I_015535 [Malus domestica]
MSFLPSQITKSHGGKKSREPPFTPLRDQTAPPPPAPRRFRAAGKLTAETSRLGSYQYGPRRHRRDCHCLLRKRAHGSFF